MWLICAFFREAAAAAYALWVIHVNRLLQWEGRRDGGLKLHVYTPLRKGGEAVTCMEASVLSSCTLTTPAMETHTACLPSLAATRATTSRAAHAPPACCLLPRVLPAAACTTATRLFGELARRNSGRCWQRIATRRPPAWDAITLVLRVTAYTRRQRVAACARLQRKNLLLLTWRRREYMRWRQCGGRTSSLYYRHRTRWAALSKAPTTCGCLPPSTYAWRLSPPGT